MSPSHPLFSNSETHRQTPSVLQPMPASSTKKTTHAPMQPAAFLRAGLVTVAILGGLLTGCASSYEGGAPESTVQSDATAPAAEAELMAQESGNDSPNGTDVPESLPQLVKRAELSLDVENVDDAIDQVTAIARGVGGDLLMLQNQTPPDETSIHTASMELRVPQAQLEPAIEQLSELGTVDQQFLTAEDVSSQLVDFEARLRNLRKAEETVLGIMERSGEVGDVLLVAQELRNIRQSIEQIDGQLANLRNQVRYSTVSVFLSSDAAGIPSQSTVVTQLSSSWRQATRSFGAFTVGLMQLGIWLLVYSPYWLAFAAIGYGAIRLVKGDRQPPPQASQPPQSSQET
ncbi:MAG: DUF4349 domain-containing protein [Leptolyngbyaceae bacterium]|nr:DUF4349 domain-containing protein [Leptolyngbyaceae bacterium]